MCDNRPLPDDCMRVILDELSLTDLDIVADTSSQFQGVAKDILMSRFKGKGWIITVKPDQWPTLTITETESRIVIVDSESFLLIKNNFLGKYGKETQTISLIINANAETGLKVFKAISSSCPNLVELSLYCDELNTLTFVKPFEHLQKLRLRGKARVVNNPTNTEHSFSSNFHKVKRLEFQNFELNGGWGSTHLPMLEEFHTGWFSDETDIRNIISIHNSTLKELNIDMWSANNGHELLKFVRNTVSNLEELHLNRYSTTLEPGNLAFNKVHTLKITSKNFEQWTQMFTYPKLQNFETIVGYADSSITWMRIASSATVKDLRIEGILKDIDIERITNDQHLKLIKLTAYCECRKKKRNVEESTPAQILTCDCDTTADSMIALCHKHTSLEEVNLYSERYAYQFNAFERGLSGWKCTAAKEDTYHVHLLRNPASKVKGTA